MSKINIRDLTFQPEGNYKRKVKEASDKMKFKISDSQSMDDVVPHLFRYIDDLEKAQQQFTVEVVGKLIHKLDLD